MLLYLHKIILAPIIFMLTSLIIWGIYDTHYITFSGQSFIPTKVSWYSFLIYIPLFITVLIGIYYIIIKYYMALSSLLRKNIVIGLFILFFLIQFITVLFLQVFPGWDFGSIHSIATANTIGMGVSEDNTWLKDYLVIYPNNLFLYICLLFIYKIWVFLGAFKEAHCLTIALFVNITVIFISIYFLYKLVKQQFGEALGLFCLFLCFFITPFFLYGPIFYTDTFSLPIVTFLMYKLILINTTENKDISFKSYNFIKECLWLGFIIFIGIKIKLTVLFIFLAFLIYTFLFQKKILKMYIGILCISISFIFLFNNLVIPKVMGEQYIKESEYKAFPYTHWLLIGLNKEEVGKYYDPDFQQTRANTPENRVSENVKDIRTGLSDFGIVGYLSFLSLKSKETWTDGLFFVSEKLRRDPVHKGFLHEFVLVNGQYFQGFFTFVQIIYFTILLFILYTFISMYMNMGVNIYFGLVISLLLLFSIFITMGNTFSLCI